MKKFVVAVSALTMFAFGVTAAMAKDGVDIFRTKCSHCHGYKGQGIRGYTAALKGSRLVTKDSDVDLKSTIRNGRLGDAKKFKDLPVVMYPEKDLSEAELDSLVKYLKSDLQQ